jgi:hypothetical protein
MFISIKVVFLHAIKWSEGILPVLLLISVLDGTPMALGSTQPLTEVSTRNISWGVNAAGAYG